MFSFCNYLLKLMEQLADAFIEGAADYSPKWRSQTVIGFWRDSSGYGPVIVSGSDVLIPSALVSQFLRTSRSNSVLTEESFEKKLLTHLTCTVQSASTQGFKPLDDMSLLDKSRKWKFQSQKEEQISLLEEVRAYKMLRFFWSCSWRLISDERVP